MTETTTMAVRQLDIFLFLENLNILGQARAGVDNRHVHVRRHYW